MTGRDERGGPPKPVPMTAKDARELADKVRTARQRDTMDHAQSTIGAAAASGRYSASLSHGDLDWLKTYLEGLGYKVTPRQESALGGTELAVTW